MYRRMVYLAVIVVLIGVAFRWVITERADLSPADLQRFEAQSGIDLPDAYGDLPFFLLWTRGDGQAFVTLAADLTLDGPSQRLMVPSYRYGRVGYAWLGRIAALGRVDWIPIGLMAVNLVSLAGIAAITAKLVGRFGARAYLLVLNPGLYVGFARDTAEPAGVLLLLLAVVSGSAVVAGIAAGGLGTLRPSLALGLPVRGRNLLAVIGSSAVLFGLVRAVAYLNIDDTTTPIETIVPPLTGYLDVFTQEETHIVVGAIMLLVAVGATGIVGVFRRRGWVRFSWVANVALLLSMGAFVLNDPFNWTRAAVILPVLWALPRSSFDPTSPTGASSQT
jgi:hypothetical protein